MKKYLSVLIAMLALLAWAPAVLAQTDSGVPESDFIKARDNGTPAAPPSAPAANNNPISLQEIAARAAGEQPAESGDDTERAVLPVSSNSIDRIVAVAEEDVILESELEQSIRGVREQVRARGGAMPSEELLRQQVLDRMVLNKLQVQRALGTGIRVSDSDVDQALGTVAQQNNITILDLRQTLEADGYDFSDFRDELRDELLISRLRDRVADSLPEITDTEIEILLASDRFGGAQYNLSHILIGVGDGATPSEVQAAQDEVRDVYDRLNNGLEFTAAAISYSDSQDALDGGNIGWRDLNTMPTVFASAIENIGPGEFSQPIRSPAGYHILYLNDVRDESVVMVEEAKVRHLMVSTSELVSPEEAHEHIMEMKNELESGASFDDMARDHSDDKLTSNLGGDMGWIQPNQYGPRFKQIIDSLGNGQISEPFQDQSGWHLVMLEDKRESDVTDLALRNRAREAIHSQKAEAEYDRFVRQLRDESYVDIRL